MCSQLLGLARSTTLKAGSKLVSLELERLDPDLNIIAWARLEVGFKRIQR